MIMRLAGDSIYKSPANLMISRAEGGPVHRVIHRGGGWVG